MHLPLPLRQLVGRLDALSVEGTLDTPVAALAYDARRVVPGAVFFAVPRTGVEDGPAIPRAIERGAAAIVCEQSGHLPYRATRIRVANCRRAMATVAAAFHGHPSRQLQVLVVTGDAARERVACLLHQLLLASGVAAGWAGSRGCRVGERLLPPLAPEPEALDVTELLAGMRRAGCRTCVLDLAPQVIERAGLGATEVDALLVTSLEGESAPRGNPLVPGGFRLPPARGLGVGHAIANVRRGVWTLNRLPPAQGTAQGWTALRFEGGAAQPWTVRGNCHRFTPTSTGLTLRTPHGGASVRLPLAGCVNAEAGLAAAAMALGLGVPFPTVTAGLGRVGRVPGSLEPVHTGRGFHVLVDAASSGPELERVLRTVRQFTTGRVLVLFGCGSRHGLAERVAMGEAAARGADLAVVTSDNPGWEPPDRIAAQVAGGYGRLRGVRPCVVPDRAQAIRELLGQAARGDCVVLTGKGHRMVQELAGCVMPFDDRAWARAALAAVDSGRKPAEVAAS